MTTKKTADKKPAEKPTNGTRPPANPAKTPSPGEAMIAMAWDVDDNTVSHGILTPAMQMQCDLIWATRKSPDGDLHKAAVKARPGLVNAVLIAGGEPSAGLPDTCQQILDEAWS